MYAPPLSNYLFAKKYNGTFVLRIEDTDQVRNFDPEAKHIIADLNWLQNSYTEGPLKGGPYEPYFQSQRTHLYNEKLQELIKKNFVYRCFCSPEELETKRQRQITLKQAPRYDRTCLKLSQEAIEEKIKANTPCIWRMNWIKLVLLLLLILRMEKQLLITNISLTFRFLVKTERLHLCLQTLLMI